MNGKLNAGWKGGSHQVRCRKQDISVMAQLANFAVIDPRVLQHFCHTERAISEDLYSPPSRTIVLKLFCEQPYLEHVSSS